MERLAHKRLIGLVLALALLFVTAAVQAAPPRQDGAGDAPPDPGAADAGTTEECQSCHEEIHAEWVESGHAGAYSRDFLQSWKEQSSPAECLACHTTGFDAANGTYSAEGITCENCHSPVPANHPDTDIMPTLTGPEGCGNCHVDTYADWQQSQHGEESMDCVNCHDPHAADLKVEETQDLCYTCHNQESHFYEMTTHAEQGLLCTDCHLQVADTPMGDGHAQREHTFNVDLESCTQCHGPEMHYPVPEATDGAIATEETFETVPVVEAGAGNASVQSGREVFDMPVSANPLTYVLAVVAGLGLGVIVAPGLDSIYHRMRRDRDDQ